MSGPDKVRGKSLKDSGLLLDKETGYQVDDDGQIVKQGWLSDKQTGYSLNDQGQLIKNGLIFDDSTGLKVSDRGEIVKTGLFLDKETGLFVDGEGRLNQHGQLFDKRLDWQEGIDRFSENSVDNPTEAQDFSEENQANTTYDYSSYEPPKPDVYVSLTARLVSPITLTAAFAFTWMLFPEIGDVHTPLARGPLLSYAVPMVFPWFGFVMAFNAKIDKKGRYLYTAAATDLNTMSTSVLIACWALAAYYMLDTSPSKFISQFVGSMSALVGGLPVIALYWGGLIWGSFELILGIPSFMAGMRRMFGQPA